MNQERLYTAVSKMQNICDSINLDDNSNIEYVVLQGVGEDDQFANDPFIVHRITHFYNHNWTGNIDFMHIPDFKQVLYNCRKYPIIIAREKESKEIMGISTIKYDENSKDNIDPYFPIDNQKYFSITGILTKKNNPHKGIGKRIYEIAMRGYHDFNEIYQDTKLICVIDCRNKNSVNALYSATDRINRTRCLNHPMQSNIISYYLVTDEDNNMLEAPTIVVESKSIKEINKEDRPTIEYIKEEKEQFISLLKSLKEVLVKSKEKKPIINDDEAGLVSYYEIEESTTLPKIISNGTEEGNDRIPRKDDEIFIPYQLRLVR